MVSGEINLVRLLLPHWKKVGVALIAVLGMTLADVLQPWPLKIVLDYVLAGQRMPDCLATATNLACDGNKNSILNFAIVAVGIITIVDSISSYIESYIMTSVGQWVAHDIRRTVYHHVERLSLGYHDRKQTRDLITRMTNDIDAIQDVITSALMDTLINVLTIAGMLAVMFYLNWRFSLFAIGITPLLFVVVYKY